jgi:hypothetical protein
MTCFVEEREKMFPRRGEFHSSLSVNAAAALRRRCASAFIRLRRDEMARQDRAALRSSGQTKKMPGRFLLESARQQESQLLLSATKHETDDSQSSKRQA